MTSVIAVIGLVWQLYLVSKVVKNINKINISGECCPGFRNSFAAIDYSCKNEKELILVFKKLPRFAPELPERYLRLQGVC